MSTAFWSLLVISLISSAFVESSRILVLFYHPGPSHFYSLYPLFNELAERGHNITVLSYSHVKEPHKNYNELLLSEMNVLNASFTFDDMVSEISAIINVRNYCKSTFIFSYHLTVIFSQCTEK